MTEFETIIYDNREGKAYITLNRPKALNAYNMRMRDDLYQVLQAVRDDDEVRVIIVQGAGDRAFCAGADLTEFLTAPPPVSARRVRWERDNWGLFLSIDKPFIAALQGYVLGDGIEIAMCCDIRIAADNVQMGAPEAGLGIIPAAGGSQTIPRVTGRAHALDLLLTGRWVKAEEALKMKLVNRVVTREELLPEVEKTADIITGYNTEAVRLAKQAITRGLNMSLKQGLEMEAELRAYLLAEAM